MSRRLRTTTAVVAACATAALGLTTAVGASASTSTSATAAASKAWSQTLDDTVGAPFAIALAKGDVWYTDGAASTVNRIHHGKSMVVAHGPMPGEVAGLAASADGRSYAYTTTDYSNGATTLTIRTAGKAPVVADLSTYEQRHNPDGWRTYGIVKNESSDPQCARDVLGGLTGGQATYKGGIDSHPYAVASLGNGAWAVADAGGNDILKVDRHGRISVIAVLPPQPIMVTAEMAAAAGLPPCVAGVTYAFEPVPTDVERGERGMLWVSTLPGGPEDPSLGARGSVYMVNPWNHSSTRRATGFLGATDLALGSHGAIYVTELFAGKVSKLQNGRITTAAEISSPLSVEAWGGYLYVGSMGQIDQQTGEVKSPGAITRIRP